MGEVKLPNSWSEWETSDLIGAGSYGSVYEVVNRETGKKEAVKILTIPKEDNDVDTIRKTLGSDESVRSYYLNLVMEFNYEIRNLERLSSCDNVVKIKDSYVQENKESIGWKIFIRMELLEESSERLLKQTGNEAELLRYAIDICNALVKCEEEGIMHRDIKPDNILVSESGRYKLCDFGVAKNMEKTLATNSVQGTFSYMAPEVYNGKKYGSQADLYSLGLILYQYANKGRLPFINTDKKIIYFKDKEDALIRRMTGDPMPAPVNASAGLAEIILKACEYSPEDRYKTAEELRSDLISLQQGRYKLKNRNGQKKKFEITITRKQARRITAVAIAAAIFVFGAFAGSKMVNSLIKDTFVLNGIEYSLNNQGVLTISAADEDIETDASELEKFNCYNDGTAVNPDSYAYRDPQFIDVTLANEYGSKMPIFSSSKIQIVNIGSDVCVIEQGWFKNCENLKEVNISSDLEVIEDEAFSGCRNLEKINIPDTTVKIGSSAFYDCEKLKSVELPYGLEDIGEYAFCGCVALESIEIPASIRELKYGSFCGCKGLTDAVLNEGLEHIGSLAFMGCEKLETINLPESVKAIDEEPFGQCDSLKNPVQNKTMLARGTVENGKAVIPEGIKEIGSFAFAGNGELEVLEIPASIETIGNNAFYECSGLREVAVPDTVNTIGEYAFADCDKLEAASLPEHIDGANQNTFSGCNIEEPMVINGETVLIKGTVRNGQAVIAGNIDRISENAFYENSEVREVFVPENVEYVGKGAFAKCEGLKHAELPGSIETVEDTIFEESGLETIVLKDGIKSISANAFSSCGSLKEVTLPDSVEYVGDGAFADCQELANIFIPHGVKTIEGNPFSGCNSLGQVYIRGVLYHGVADRGAAHLPEGTKRIARDAFCENTEIEEADLPDGVISVDDSAFYACSNLKKVTVPESIKIIDNFAFDNTEIREVAVPFDTYIGKNAFPKMTQIIW